MSPRLYSRYSLCTAHVDAVTGRLTLDERTPFRFRNVPDNRTHTVREGDTLWTLAGHYFAPHPRASGLWWVIADYQPQPIFDPTVALASGSTVVIPSLRTVLERVFSESRRLENGA